MKPGDELETITLTKSQWWHLGMLAQFGENPCRGFFNDEFNKQAHDALFKFMAVREFGPTEDE